VPTTQEIVTLFAALWLIAQPNPVTDSAAAWMSCDTNGAIVWQTGKALGLVGPWERSWAMTPPFRPISDHRFDLSRLRERAKPAMVPMRMPNN
jgi:hypothetical protein